MATEPFDVRRTRVSLFDALLRARAKAGGKAKVLEDQERKVLTYDDLIRASFALGNKIKGFSEPKERLGVLLPTAVGAAATFFALHAAGRVPAMLNFTAGPMNLKAAIRQGGIRTILTARRFVDQANLQALVEDLSTVARIVYLEDVRAKLNLFDKLGALWASLSPERHRASAAPDDEGVVLFTSGSFGSPRGVVLSHANLVANVEQCASHVEFDPEWVFFNPLPVFHCFGLTGGMLLPLFRGHKVFLYPSPLHFKIIPKLIKESGANVLFATDTFAQQFARSAADEDMSCLRIAVLGAEKVRDETRAIYDRRFGCMLLEGYGATEASPVIAVNQPYANRAGSVGRILPGMEVLLEDVPGISEGKKLVVRGPNVMKGYLNADMPDGIEPLPGGWHDTGDIVSLDAEGFVTIEGRVKRFAKVGGEMVSLAAVEAYAEAVWPDWRHAAVALPCPRKGERVILVSEAPSADTTVLLHWAQRNGAPEIAIPRKIVPVPSIPVLGSGKTDYVAVAKIAENAVDAQAA